MIDFRFGHDCTVPDRVFKESETLVCFQHRENYFARSSHESTVRSRVHVKHHGFPVEQKRCRRSAGPIQPMSVGKPIRSGTTEKRPRNCGRVQGRTGGPRATGQGWPVCLHDQSADRASRRRTASTRDGSMDSAGPAASIRRQNRIRPPLHVMNGPQADRPRKAVDFLFGLRSIASASGNPAEDADPAGRRFRYLAPTPINNCDPSSSARWQKKS